MKKISLICLVCTLIFSCSSSKKNTGVNNSTNGTNVSSAPSVSGDGSSYENAVFINENSESKGVPAEYAWLKEKYPGHSVVKQSLNYNNKKPYDIIEIKTSDRITKNVYFDISKFYGKF